MGGLVVTKVGKRHARIDRIFVDPAFQRKGIGSNVLEILEEEFPHVGVWELETSSRQLNNHSFYEKMGYKKIHESHDEFCYEKKKTEESCLEVESRELSIQGDTLKNVDLSELQVEHSHLVKTEFYGINGTSSSFSNSNLSGLHLSNCNLSEARFQNINLQGALIADLNLSNSEFALVSLGGVHVHDTNIGDGSEPIKFERCDLRGSKIQNCNLSNVHISDSDITGMKINGICVKDLLEAYTLIQENRKE